MKTAKQMCKDLKSEIDNRLRARVENMIFYIEQCNGKYSAKNYHFNTKYDENDNYTSDDILLENSVKLTGDIFSIDVQKVLRTLGYNVEVKVETVPYYKKIKTKEYTGALWYKNYYTKIRYEKLGIRAVTTVSISACCEPKKGKHEKAK